MKNLSSKWAMLGMLGLIGWQSLPATAAVTYTKTVNPNDTRQRLLGENPGDSFGIALAGLGDLDGDGFEELIVGAPYNDDSFYTGGKATVFSGRTKNIMYEFLGRQDYSFLGSAVANAGDVNADGINDILISASGSTVIRGRVYVYSGSDGRLLYRYQGLRADDGFGRSIDGAGDVNGDGYDDIIIGASHDKQNGRRAGLAHVYSGFDGSLLYTWYGQREELFGIAVSSAGDVNRDGHDDLLIGAPGANHNGDTSGSAYVFSGHNGQLLYRLDGNNAWDSMGSALDNTGDLNGDQHPDLLVSSMWDDSAGPGNGMVQAYSGADGSVLYEVYGESNHSYFGYAIKSIADLNRDGTNDFIVGAFLHENNQGKRVGQAKVFSGKDGRVIRSWNGRQEYGSFGYSVGGIKNFGHRGLQTLVGVSNDDNRNGDDAGKVVIRP